MHEVETVDAQDMSAREYQGNLDERAHALRPEFDFSDIEYHLISGSTDLALVEGNTPPSADTIAVMFVPGFNALRSNRAVAKHGGDEFIARADYLRRHMLDAGIAGQDGREVSVVVASDLVIGSSPEVQMLRVMRQARSGSAVSHGISDFGRVFALGHLGGAEKAALLASRANSLGIDMLGLAMLNPVGVVREHGTGILGLARGLLADNGQISEYAQQSTNNPGGDYAKSDIQFVARAARSNVHGLLQAIDYSKPEFFSTTLQAAIKSNPNLGIDVIFSELSNVSPAQAIMWAIDNVIADLGQESLDSNARRQNEAEIINSKHLLEGIAANLHATQITGAGYPFTNDVHSGVLVEPVRRWAQNAV